MGHLYQRGPVWWIQFYQDGQRVRMTTESTDENVAKRMLKEHEARVTLKEPLVARTARVTYDELRADLVAHYQATESRDLTEAGWRLKHLDRFFRGARASQITAAVITKYIVQRQQEEIVSPKKKQRRHRANGTIVREISVLLKMLRLGVEHNKLSRLPIVHKPEEAAARQGFLEPSQFEAIRAQLPADVAVIVTLLYDNASRLREVTYLQRTQVDLDAGCIRLRQPKTKTLVAVYLRPETLAMLRAHVERIHELERETDQVIPHLFPIFPGPGISHKLVGRQRDNFACVGAGPHRGGLPRGPRPRSTAKRSPKPRPGGRARARGDVDLGASEPKHIRPLQHHERGRPPGGGGPARRGPEEGRSHKTTDFSHSDSHHETAEGSCDAELAGAISRLRGGR